MEAKDLLLTVFMVSLLLLAAMFVGDIIGQTMRGSSRYLNDIEISVIFSAGLLCLEVFVIMLFRKKKKKDTENISELVKEARTITY